MLADPSPLAIGGRYRLRLVFDESDPIDVEVAVVDPADVLG